MPDRALVLALQPSGDVASIVVNFRVLPTWLTVPPGSFRVVVIFPPQFCFRRPLRGRDLCGPDPKALVARDTTVHSMKNNLRCTVIPREIIRNLRSENSRRSHLAANKPNKEAPNSCVQVPEAQANPKRSRK